MKNKQNITYFSSSKNILVFIMENDIFAEYDLLMSLVHRSVLKHLDTPWNMFV